MDDIYMTVYRLLPAAERCKALESDWKMAFPKNPNTSRINLLSEELVRQRASSKSARLELSCARSKIISLPSPEISKSPSANFDGRSVS
jgi:hypothetical protein